MLGCTGDQSLEETAFGVMEEKRERVEIWKPNEKGLRGERAGGVDLPNAVPRRTLDLAKRSSFCNPESAAWHRRRQEL